MIRKAASDDINYIIEIFEEIILYEEKHTKYTAFQLNVYPTRATVEKALNEDSLYVYEVDGEVSACLILSETQPDEYETIDWRFAASAGNVIVIHLLCVDPRNAGGGIGRKMVDFAIEEGRRRNCSVIRLDTGGQNTPARNLYEKIGFTVAGASNMSIGGLIPHSDHLFYEMKIQ